MLFDRACLKKYRENRIQKVCRKTEVCTVQYTIKPHLPAFFLLPGKSLRDGVDAHRHYVSYSLRSKYADLVE